VILFVYERAHQGLEARCAAGKTAMAWLFGTFTCFFLSMCLEGLILQQSLRGAILQPNTRARVNALLYAHFAVTIADVFFTALGTLLDYHVGNSCYVRNHVHTAVVVVIVGNYFIIACNFLGVALIFSVFAHLPSEERWNRMFSVVGWCVCMPAGSDRERESQGTLSQIATCFGEVFQGADLVPSDIAAGLALLALQHRGKLEGEPLGWSVTEGAASKSRRTREARKNAGKKATNVSRCGDHEVTAPLLSDGTAEETSEASTSDDGLDDATAATLGEPMSPEALSDMLAEAAHYARWALAAYGWMLYTWANPTGGLVLACSARGFKECCCCCCPAEAKKHGTLADSRGTRVDPESGLPEQDLANIGGDVPDSLDREALKTCAGIKGEDLFYVSFTNGAGEQPYFIARDTARKAIVVSVRGTMSVQDCITDSMYKPVLLSADAIGMPHLKGKQLHCHAGVVTATNFILSDLERHRVLHQVLLGESVPERQDADAPRGSSGDQRLEYEQARGHEGWTLVLCGHSLGAGVATVLSLHLRQKFPDVRVWGIEPPGGLLSAELAKACGEWTVSSIHGNDLIARLSGPCLLKLRKDLVDALARCKVSKFSLLARMTFGVEDVEESDVLMPPGEGPTEATELREAFERFHSRQVSERPLMAAELYPPGRLLHLRRLPVGRRRFTSLAEAYEARWVTAKELMRCGLLVTNDFFTDHFPDKVVAVLSELAMKYSAASSNTMTRHYSFSSEALGGDASYGGTGGSGNIGPGGGGRSAAGKPGKSGSSRRGQNLMEDLVKEQRSERGGSSRDND
jgi:sn1-specific diacylglycerol lipase